MKAIRAVSVLVGATAVALAAGGALLSQTQTQSVFGRITINGRGATSGVLVWIDQTHGATTNENGDYRIEDLASGTYVIKAWSERCLATVIDTVEVSSADVRANGTLYPVDVVEDGRINLLDAGKLLQHFGATPDSSAWDGALDLDGSGTIDSLDVALVMRHWRGVGEDYPLVVTEPAPGAVWEIGHRYPAIRWHSGVAGGTASILLMKNGEPELRDTIACCAPNTGSYSWYVDPETLVPGTGYRVRVYVDEDHFGLSGPFEIRSVPGILRVISPDNHTVWTKGQTSDTIRWESSDYQGTATISLWKGTGFVDTIAVSAPNSGSYGGYVVSRGPPAGADYRVQVRLADDSYAFSDFFSIWEPARIVVTEPNSNTIWYNPQEGIRIQWSTGDLAGTVNVDLYMGDTLYWYLARGVPNSGSYVFDLSANTSETNRLPYRSGYRVRVYLDEREQALSAPFQIRRNIAVTWPGGYEAAWRLGEERVPILWDPGDVVGNVSIELQRNGVLIATIVTSTPNDGRYDEYNVPTNLEVGSYNIVVRRSERIWARGSAFQVVQRLYVTEPNAGTRWAVGQRNVPIYWDTGELGGNVSITLYRHVSSAYVLVDTIAGSTPNDGSFSDYAVPADVASGSYRVRVFYSNDYDDYSPTFSIVAYYAWLQENPILEYDSLRGVCLANWRIGWSVGLRGTVLRTNDGGATWTRQASCTSADLYAVSFADTSHGSAVGSGPTIIHTADGGRTWSEQHAGDFSIGLSGVSMTDSSTGTAVGFRVITRTIDGGATWVRQTSPAGLSPHCVFFLDRTRGWIVGDNLNAGPTIIGTTDAGETWTGLRPSSVQENFRGVCFTDASRGTVVGDSTVLRTTDGGITWTKRTAGFFGIALCGVSFPESWRGVIVGSAGTILRTRDSGATWTMIASNTFDNLYGVSLKGGSTGIAVGDYGRILRTTDGGLSWTSVAGGLTADLAGVALVDTNTAVAIGRGGTILRRANGAWAAVASPTTSHLRGVSFASAAVGTAVGDNGVIIRTTDGGLTWSPQTSGTSRRLAAVCLVNESVGMAVGDRTILRTTDGGETWVAQTSSMTGPLNGVSFTSPDTGTVVGSCVEDLGGWSTGVPLILHTTDGGATWVRQWLHLSFGQYEAAVLRSVSFVDANTGFAVGDFYHEGTGTGPIVCRTSDGGATWVDLSATYPLWGGLGGVSFTDARTGTAVGSGGGIARTSDGGTTWSSELSPSTRSLSSVHFIDANTGIAVGSQGVIVVRGMR